MKKHSTSLSPNLTTSSAKSRVLLVEDNNIAQSVACVLLNQLNCQVDIAATGSEALARFQEKDYDLIFMDIGLGEGMDGYEVTHHIRRSTQESRFHTPIIALTAHAEDDNKKRCIEAGMDAVLAKPLTLAKASDILSTFITARREQSVQTNTNMPWRDLPANDEALFKLEPFALFDEEQALSTAGNKALLIELLTLMQQKLPDDLQAMKEAFNQYDYALVDKIAHKIKGGAVYVGAIRMKYACQYLERYWKTGQKSLFTPLYHQAIEVIEATWHVMIQWLDEQL